MISCLEIHVISATAGLTNYAVYFDKTIYGLTGFGGGGVI